MKKLNIFIIPMLVFTLNNTTFALGAPDATAAIHAQTLWQKANASIQNNEFVQTVLFLKKNYNQTKEYYEYIQELNRYKGGIGAYFRDSIINAFKNTQDTALYDLQSAWDDPNVDKSTYVEEIEAYTNRKIEKFHKNIDKKIDALFKEEQAKKERQEIQAKAIDRYTTLASKDSLSNSEKNEMDKLQGTILVNTVASIQRELEIMNAREAQRELEEQQALKRDIKDLENIKLFLSSIKEQEDQKKANNKKLMKDLTMRGVSYGK